MLAWISSSLNHFAHAQVAAASPAPTASLTSHALNVVLAPPKVKGPQDGFGSGQEPVLHTCEGPEEQARVLRLSPPHPAILRAGMAAGYEKQEEYHQGIAVM